VQDYLQEFLQPYIRSESTQFYLAPEASSASNNNNNEGLGPLGALLPFGPPGKWLQNLRGGNDGTLSMTQGQMTWIINSILMVAAILLVLCC